MSYIYDSATNSFSGETQNPGGLGQVMWHITDKCMLDCAICLTKKMRIHESFVSEASISEYIMLLKMLGVKKVDISGGEPLLYPYLNRLVSTCVQNGISITITTSGLGLKENLSWVCQNWSLFSRIILSLDGRESLHNRLRGSAVAYSALCDFQKMLKAANCKNVRINTVVTKHLLLEQERMALCTLVAELSPIEWCLIQPYPINKTERFDDLTTDASEFSAFVAKCRECPALSDIRIDQRTNADYTSYWSLFPDGYLYYSSNQIYYDVKIELTPQNLQEIKETVMKYPQTYISTKEREV